jgi:putative oxidoreductase
MQFRLKGQNMTSGENVLNLQGRIAIATLFLPAGLNELIGVEGTTGYFTSLGLPSEAILVWRCLLYWRVLLATILGGTS